MYTTLPPCAQSFAESILRQKIKLIDGESHKQSLRPRWRSCSLRSWSGSPKVECFGRRTAAASTVLAEAAVSQTVCPVCPVCPAPPALRMSRKHEGYWAFERAVGLSVASLALTLHGGDSSVTHQKASATRHRASSLEKTAHASATPPFTPSLDSETVPAVAFAA